MQRRKYRNPPIEEAVCDFRFAPSTDWNPTLPGLLYEKLKDTYKETPRQQNVLEVPAPGQTLAPVGAAGPFTQRVQLVAEKGTRIVGISADHLSVHMMRPYSSWEEFRPMILDALRAYRKIANPEGINRIGLRYINRINIPYSNVKLEDYFTRPPIFPELKQPTRKRAFLDRKEAEFVDRAIRMVVTFADTEPKLPEMSSYLLDIDILWTSGIELIPLSAIGKALDEMKARERQVFESLITDQSRRLFDDD
jgi:uncharacterized protein (TIGR04255 family)